jgi:hypothetical protein
MCAARAAAAVNAVRLGSPLAITRARLQPIILIIAQNNLYNNGNAITLKRQYARPTNSTDPPRQVRWSKPHPDSGQSLLSRRPFPRADRAIPPDPGASRPPFPEATAGSPDPYVSRLLPLITSGRVALPPR